MIVWLIGMSGAGKTTVGKLLYRRLKPTTPNLVFLDGDDLRDVWGDSLGHTVEARRTNAQRISQLCRMLDRQGIHAIATVLSIFPDWQKWNRENFSQYLQVYLDVPMDVLRERDTKDLYANAEAGRIKNVVGVDIAFPAPVGSDLIISGAEATESAEKIADRVLARLPTQLGSDART